MILKRNESDRFSRVVREWEGRTVVLIAGGPSLTAEQVGRVAVAHSAGMVKCIVVNDGYLIAPFADVCYFADSHWWDWHRKGIPKPGISAAEVARRFASFAGQKCSIQSSGSGISDASVHILKNRDYPIHGYGLSKDAGALVTGRHGGFQALNLAILAGAKRCLLLGYDARSDGDRDHWFGSHPSKATSRAYHEFIKSFSMAEKEIHDSGVAVINCSPGSAINTFPKMSIGEALDEIR